MATDSLRSRIAPTPSGFLHLGNAFNFILTWAITRQNGGKLLLRIDDMDTSRSRIEYIDEIFAILDWLEISWDEGPKDSTDFCLNFSQGKKIELYRSYLDKIVKKLYACDCSRSKLQDHCFDPCRHQNKKNIPHQTALRLLIDDPNLHKTMGDCILWRKDDLPAYQLVSVIEDELEKINFIVRGKDLLTSTHCQKYLAKLLDFKHFNNATILHHKLMTDSAGAKLSKTQGSSDLRTWRTNANNKENKISLIHQFCNFFSLPQVDSLAQIVKLDLSSIDKGINE